MSRSASGVVEEYLSRLRSELSAAGAEDTDELVAEIRSLLDEASSEDPDATEVYRFDVDEFTDRRATSAARVGTTAFTVGQRRRCWLRLGCRRA